MIQAGVVVGLVRGHMHPDGLRGGIEGAEARIDVLSCRKPHQAVVVGDGPSSVDWAAPPPCSSSTSIVPRSSGSAPRWSRRDSSNGTINFASPGDGQVMS